MKALEERIRRDGVVKSKDVLKVDVFLNHQMDVSLFKEMAKEWGRLFSDRPINKILTIEASGIGIAAIVAAELGVPVVFAKKSQSINLDGSSWCTKVQSFTHGKVFDVIVSKKFIGPDDHVLLIDDFMANGCAMNGLIDVCEKAGATVEGIGIAIEKGFRTAGMTCASAGTVSNLWPSSKPWTPKRGDLLPMSLFKKTSPTSTETDADTTARDRAAENANLEQELSSFNGRVSVAKAFPTAFSTSWPCSWPTWRPSPSSPRPLGSIAPLPPCSSKTP